MAKTIVLTSPYARGEHVKELQKLLKEDNYYNQPIDGVYGPYTAQAVYRAKYWMGYLKPDQAAGDVLFAYLKGERKPTPEMAKRRQQRLDAKKKQAAQPGQRPATIGSKALTAAFKDLGVSESPAGSNHTKYGAWYGVDYQPWCAIFCTYFLVRDGGSKAFKKGSHYAYVPYVLSDAHAGRNNLTLTKNPLHGDLVLYDWQGDKLADHIGFFDKWIDKARGTFKALEGNTSGSNQSNGGRVEHRDRDTRTVIAFVHVGA